MQSATQEAVEKANNAVMDIPHTYAAAYRLGVIQDTPEEDLLSSRGLLADFSDGPWSAFTELCRAMENAFPGSQAADQLSAIPRVRHRTRELSSALRSLLQSQLQARVATLRKMQAHIETRRPPLPLSTSVSVAHAASSGGSSGGSSDEEGVPPPLSTPRLTRRTARRNLIAPDGTPAPPSNPPPTPLRSAMRGSRDTPQPPSASRDALASPAHSRSVSVDTGGVLLRAASDAGAPVHVPPTAATPGTGTGVLLGTVPEARSSPRREGGEGGSPHRRGVSLDSAWGAGSVDAAANEGGGAASPVVNSGAPAAPWLGRTPLHLRQQGGTAASSAAKQAPVPAHLRAGVCGKEGAGALNESAGGAHAVLVAIVAEEAAAHHRLLAITTALRSACDGVVRICGDDGGGGTGAAGGGRRGRQGLGASGAEHPLTPPSKPLSDDAEACLLLTRLITRVRRDGVAAAAALERQAARLAQAQHLLLASCNGELTPQQYSSAAGSFGVDQFASRESYDLGSGDVLGPLPEGVQGGYGRADRAATAGDLHVGGWQGARPMPPPGASRASGGEWGEARTSRATSNPTRPRWQGGGAQQ